MSEAANGLSNSLLDAILRRFTPQPSEIETLTLPVRTPLLRSGDRIRYLWFPVSAVISLTRTMQDGATVEVATIGREGCAGLVECHGSGVPFADAEIQVPGVVRRVSCATFQAAWERCPRLRDLGRRYVEALLGQVMQGVACNALHTLDRRLCRWILMFEDRVNGATLELTQDLLAQMLGVQRTSVTDVAQRLKERGLIDYARGRVRILDRVGLEAAACECYSEVRANYSRLLPE